MTSQEALIGKEYTVILYLYDSNGNLISTEQKGKQYPYYVGDNSALLFGDIFKINVILDSYEYHQKPDYLLPGQHYIEGYRTTFKYEIELDGRYEYKQPIETEFYHVYNWIRDDVPEDVDSRDFEIWEPFQKAKNRPDAWEGYRSMTENDEKGVIDARIFSNFRLYIHLKKRERTPTYLPVRNDSGVIVRHYSTNVIFRDE